MLAYLMSEKVQTSQLKPNKCACQVEVSTSSKINTMREISWCHLSTRFSLERYLFPHSTVTTFLKGVERAVLVAKSHLFSQDIFKAFLSSHVSTHLLLTFLRKQRCCKMCRFWNCESLENSFSLKHVLCFFRKKKDKRKKEKKKSFFRSTFLVKLHLAKGGGGRGGKVFSFKIWKVFPCLPTLLVLTGVFLISTDPGFL